MYSNDYHAKVEAARVAAAEKAAAEAEAARVKAEAEAAEAEAARVKAEAEAAEAARVAAVRASVLAHMKMMEDINKQRPPPPPPPPPVVHAPNGYAISPRVANFPPDYNYYPQPAERPVPVYISPEALAYQNSEQELANQLESDARLDLQLDSLRRGMGGGRKKKSKRQKKQHRRRNRRRSTRKYRK